MRAWPGESGAGEVDPKKIRRHAKEAARKVVALGAGGTGSRPGGLFDPALPFGNRIFLNWNMPHGALGSSRSKDTDHPSPLGQFVSTPGAISDVSVSTPPANAASPPYNAPSPLSTALRRKTAVDRARLFVQGKHDDLIRSMDKTERRTAKYWGRGPRDWTADNLGFSRHQEPISIPSPNTLGMIANSPDAAAGHQSRASLSQKPSSLCHWSIHVEEVDYEPVLSPPQEQGHPDPQEEGAWAEWPESWGTLSFEERLRNGLESNDFSNIKADELPLAVPQVAKAAERSPNEFLEESLGFAIMTGNFDLVENLISKIIDSKVDVSSLYPYHLATSYLHGPRSCCNILDLLYHRIQSIESEDQPASGLRELYVNSLGHTVFDNLMIAILKGHTSILPGIVDDALKKENRFVGEEVDICGRWDADSDCYRELLESGRLSIPFEWKHKFCHTSAQTVCHCIDTIDSHSSWDAPSGLFLKHCSHCGQKLQLLPLHTLVLTAIYLAEFGCEDEDLFGMVACLFCLFHGGANSRLKAHISVASLLGTEQADYCDHEELTPVELVRIVPTVFTDKWPSKAKTGWQVFCHVLRIAHDEQVREDSTDGVSKGPDANSSYGSTCFIKRENGECEFGENMYLGHIWAAIQTELLAYRRIGSEDPWISENIDMADLLECMEAGTGVSIPMVEEGMMNPYCSCGRFGEWYSLPLREDAAAYYFSNLDGWSQGHGWISKFMKWSTEDTGRRVRTRSALDD
ncbi:hypothetical protein FGG08_000457 [Glutinoglossum americanum]|uniref:Uncharacterized protein n=1 Tax=Glutinoglossum americanum TaxID=1670608 RepID=A0A9P8L3R9_9PEZI|nr:hypothetical protein FGG08_000457 [Glutinoglossum americanum]